MLSYVREDMFIPSTFAHPFASPPPLWSAARQIEFDVALQTRRGIKRRWCMAPHSHDGSHPKRTSIARMLLRVLPLPRCMTSQRWFDPEPHGFSGERLKSHIIHKTGIAHRKSSSIILLKLPCIDNSPRVYDCHTVGPLASFRSAPCAAATAAATSPSATDFFGLGRPSTTECEKDLVSSVSKS